MGNKRKTFLINRPFQLRVLGLFAALAIAMLFVWLASSQIFFWRLIEQGKNLGFAPDHVYFRFIETQRQQNISMILVMGTLMAVGVCVCGLRLTHRIAGPLYQLNRYLNSLRDTKKVTKPIKFRDGDYFPEIAVALNEALASMNQTQKDSST